MDKIHARTAQAVRRVTRRAQRQKALVERDQSFNIRWQRLQYGNALRKLKKDARIRTREDWELGALAPRRDVGDGAERYGTIPGHLLGTQQEVDKKDQKWIPFAVGDRVVVIKGYDKGKIGRVVDRNTKGQSVTVDGLNTYTVYIAKWMRKQDQNPAPTRPAHGNIPVDNLRLVLPVINPETGVAKDTIIDRIERRFEDGRPPPTKPEEMYWKGEKRKYFRVIPALDDQEIPWTEREPVEYDEYEDDTLRITVDQRTWIPTLLSLPMPETVIDELRHKYSSFRNRNTPEYIQAVEEDAKRKRLEATGRASEMQTPLKQLQKRLRKDLKKSSGAEARQARGELVGNELLSRLGELILESKNSAKKGYKDSPVKRSLGAYEGATLDVPPSQPASPITSPP